MRCNVVHHGVPIGSVELPAGRPWAGGTLQPSPAFEPLQELFAAVAGPEVAARILRLPADEPIFVDDLDPALAAKVERVAALAFELEDERGLTIATDVVRLAHPGDRAGVLVMVQFRDASAGIPAAPRPRQSRGRAEEP